MDSKSKVQELEAPADEDLGGDLPKDGRISEGFALSSAIVREYSVGVDGCPALNKGVTPWVGHCRDLGMILPHNRAHCCRAKCASEARVCIACAFQGESPDYDNRVADPDKGLCAFHLAYGPKARYPQRSEPQRVSTVTSLASIGVSRMARREAVIGGGFRSPRTPKGNIRKVGTVAPQSPGGDSVAFQNVGEMAKKEIISELKAGNIDELDFPRKVVLIGELFSRFKMTSREIADIFDTSIHRISFLIRFMRLDRRVLAMTSRTLPKTDRLASSIAEKLTEIPPAVQFSVAEEIVKNRLLSPAAFKLIEGVRGDQRKVGR